MKKLFLILPALLFSLFLALSPGKAFAAYDPNLVITDAQLTAKDTMTEAQIQDFLVAKGSFLANYTVPAARTVTYYVSPTKQITTYENTVIGPYGVSTEVDVTGWKASRVIWQVSQWYGVNPQVVLTIIQKESSFVQRSDGSIAVPGSNDYATYAWMMGYAYTEDTTDPAKNVCGVATPGANPTKSCAGLAAQLDNGTWAVANWMNLANAHSSGNNYSCPSWSGSYWTNYATRLCDGDWVTPASGATAALYRYTPHTGLTGGYAGAKAFYLIYNNWFNFAQYIQDSLKVSSSYSLSNYSPAVGEEVTATFSLHNSSAGSIAVSMVGVAAWYSYPSFNPQDIGFNGSTTFAANETKTFTFKRTFSDIGYYRSWVSFCFDGKWYQALNEPGNYTTRDFNTHRPDIRISPVSLNPSSPIVGQNVTASTVIRNYEPKPITLSMIGIANWSNYPNFSPADFGFVSNQTLAAYGDAGGGDILPLAYTRTFGATGNNYRAWVSFLIGGKWYDILWGSEKYYKVSK